MERLSGLDASFLYMETPQVQMHVAFATILDPSEMPGGYSFASLSEAVYDKVMRKPAFRRRLVQVPFSLHHPLWVEDPDFDIIHHVRQVALPKPGTLVELGAMVGRINSTPLDRSRPLWELWVIEGLENGKFAILLKFHHAFVDGVSGAALLMHLLDAKRTPARMSPPPIARGEDIPSDLELVAHAMKSRVKQPSLFLALAKRSVEAVQHVVGLRNDPKHTDSVTVFQAPPTHFNQSVTARRNLAFARISLDDIKEVKNLVGCTVNDVVICVAGGAFRQYLLGRGALPSIPLTAVCPISVRTKEQQDRADNQVSAMWTHLGTHIEDPVERARAIHEVTVGAKEEFNAIGAHMLQDWAELAAPTTFATAARLYSRLHIADKHRPVHNLVLSNVPGPRFPLYFAGAQAETIYPIGPVMEGAGLNLTVMSYLESVDFSFNVDSALVPDVWDLASLVEPAMKELLDVARDRAGVQPRGAKMSPDTQPNVHEAPAVRESKKGAGESAPPPSRKSEPPSGGKRPKKSSASVAE
ncbi:MAG: wax ester/triacylglycerol synthase family O-acyltransferase [Polyangiales bacterium]